MPNRKRVYRQSSTAQSPPGSSEDDEFRESLECVRMWQKLRFREKHGISVDTLADKIRCSNASQTKDERRKQKDVAARDLESLMKGNFARETDGQEEDERMLAFVERELKKRRSAGSTAKNDSDGSNNEKSSLFTRNPLDEALVSASRRFMMRDSNTHRTEETLSEQMLSGIPEVDLGFEEKVRNIKETELMRTKVLEKLKEKKTDEPVVDFVLHCRFNPNIECELPTRLDSPVNDDREMY